MGGRHGRAWRFAGSGFKQATTAGKGQRGGASRPGAAPRGSRRRRWESAALWRKGARSACLSGGPDDVYPRVVTPASRSSLVAITRSGEGGALRGEECGASPLLFRLPGSGLPFALLSDGSPSIGARIEVVRGTLRPDPRQDGLSDVEEATSRCAGRPLPPSLSVFVQVRGLERFGSGAGATAARRSRRLRPLPPACRTRSAAPARSRRRCPFEPRPRGVPRSAGEPCPGCSFPRCCRCPLEPRPRGVPRSAGEPCPVGPSPLSPPV